MALAEVYDRVSRTPPDPWAWIPLETFLMFTAKASKILKPIGVDKDRPKKPGNARDGYDRRKLRGERLRDILKVEDASPVLGRKVRDASEHFDKRLDTWTGAQPRVTAEEMEAGDLPSFPAPPMRRVDPGSWAVEVAGETLDLKAIDIELQRMLARVIEVEPLAGVEDPHFAALLAGLPPFPAELRLDAPTRRPDEDVRTGIDPQAIAARQLEFDQSIERAIDLVTTRGDGGPAEPTADASGTGEDMAPTFGGPVVMTRSSPSPCRQGQRLRITHRCGQWSLHPDSDVSPESSAHRVAGPTPGTGTACA